jgi:glucosamine-6-phosphate deaminase
MSIYIPTATVVTTPETQAGKANDAQMTLSERVAAVVREQLEAKPDSRLGLPTGRTPTAAYRILSDWSDEGELDWSQVTAFGLDEYCDVDESVSFRGYLEQNLYRHINLPKNSRFNPILTDDYDGLIADKGGLDLTLLGIGTNGHIAFNEPGTPLNSWTHIVLLTESTRAANAEFFKNHLIPTRAVTMGIRTILNSKKIVLIATGKKKQDIVTQALRGPVTEEVPASFLQLHDNVMVLTDFDF